MDSLHSSLGILERISAIPSSRRIHVPLSLSMNDAGRIAADVLRLSAESHDDILLMLPLRGHYGAVLALGQVLGLPTTAPTVGVLCGETGLLGPVLLQACTLRVVSRHAEFAPRLDLLDREYSVHSFELVGPAEQVDRTRRKIADEQAELEVERSAVLSLVSERTGILPNELLELFAKLPEYTGEEAVDAGWADVVI